MAEKFTMSDIGAGVLGVAAGMAIVGILRDPEKRARALDALNQLGIVVNDAVSDVGANIINAFQNGRIAGRREIATGQVDINSLIQIIIENYSPPEQLN